MTCHVCGTDLPAGTHKNRRYCSTSCKQSLDNRRRSAARSRRNVAESVTTVNLSEGEAAWLAGLFDGEGTVVLTHGGDSIKPNLRLVVYNTSPQIIERVRELFAKAEIDYYEKRDTRNDRTPCSNFIVGTLGALRLYPALRPWMVRQVDRFDAAVEFMAPRYRGRIRVSWTQAEIAEWESIRSRYNAR